MRKMRENFKNRVELPYRGDADLAITRPVVPEGQNDSMYWGRWEVVRRMLAEVHPCMHEPVEGCLFKRLGGIHRKRVLDCRCCGGVIVQPAPEPKVRVRPRHTIEFPHPRTRGKVREEEENAEDVDFFEIDYQGGRGKRARRV